MKTKCTQLSLILTAVSMIFLVSSNLAAQETKPFGASELFPELPGQNPHAFVGTWMVQIEITNCSTTVIDSHAKLLSVNAGGTTTDTSASSLFRSAGLGVWEHVRRQDFTYAAQFFRFNADGTLAGGVQTKWNVLMGKDGDTYTSTGAIQIVLPNGTVVANLCGTETGIRMVVPQ